MTLWFPTAKNNNLSPRDLVASATVKQIFRSFPVRGGSRTAATSKMELFVIIVNGFQPLTIITKYSILDVAAVLDPLLPVVYFLI